MISLTPIRTGVNDLSNGISGGHVSTSIRLKGERSSQTWFVLTYLLGYLRVRNYDGSWTEWGSLIGVPIER